MSYLWVYESNNTLNNIISVPNGFVSYVDYSATPINDTNYIVNSMESFNEVNEYIQYQIQIFAGTFNNSNKDRNGKTMNQRFQDISVMQVTFFTIMDNILKSYYGNNYDTITKLISTYSNNNDIIDNGLDELNGHPASINFSQNVLLDSTIFSTVLWTILAICLLYYVFIKL